MKKKSKGTKKFVKKRKLKFEDYRNCLEVAQIENQIKHLEKNKIILMYLVLRVTKRYKMITSQNWLSDKNFFDL